MHNPVYTEIFDNDVPDVDDRDNGQPHDDRGPNPSGLQAAMTTVITFLVLSKNCNSVAYVKILISKNVRKRYQILKKTIPKKWGPTFFNSDLDGFKFFLGLFTIGGTGSAQTLALQN